MAIMFCATTKGIQDDSSDIQFPTIRRPDIHSLKFSYTPSEFSRTKKKVKSLNTCIRVVILYRGLYISDTRNVMFPFGESLRGDTQPKYIQPSMCLCFMKKKSFYT